MGEIGMGCYEVFYSWVLDVGGEGLLVGLGGGCEERRLGLFGRV